MSWPIKSPTILIQAGHTSFILTAVNEELTASRVATVTMSYLPTAVSFLT